MVDAILLTPRELPPDAPSINNQKVVVTDEEYFQLPPAMRHFYEKVRENLGLACVAAHLRNAGYSVRLVNLHGRNPSDESIIELIRTERPKFIGISIMYDLHIIDAIRLARCARRADPDVVISIGGAFCTYNAKMIAEQVPEIDFVAFGEGEVTVVAVLDKIAAGADWRTVPGLWFREGLLVRSSGMPQLPDLSLVWPARDLLREHQAAGIPTRNASTYTSRGCHAKCTFCYAPRQPGVTDGPWRLRPAHDVVDEIEALQREFGTRFVWFNDDNFGGAFADGYKHAIEFAEEVIRRELKFEFHCEFRVDSGLIDSEALELMRRAGMKSALLGLETGSAGMLKRFKKGTTVAYNFDATRLFSGKGFELDPGWIMVEPGTELEDLWQNLQFIVGSDIHRSNHTDNPFLLFNRAIALRGSEMYDKVTDPMPATDLGDADNAAYRILRVARRDYRIADNRVEALWESFSSTSAELSDRRENEVPFLAHTLSDAVRAARQAEADPDTRAGLTERLDHLRKWRNDLPQLFTAIMNYGLLLADELPVGPELTERLGSGLAEIIAEYDAIHLGCAFTEFADGVRSQTSELVLN